MAGIVHALALPKRKDMDEVDTPCDHSRFSATANSESPEVTPGGHELTRRPSHGWQGQQQMSHASDIICSAADWRRSSA